MVRALDDSCNKYDAAIREIFPQVISASRATDIPAFYTNWFMEHLRKGHIEWQNPFNASQRQLVNLAQARAIVFWSKNPAPLIPYLSEISDLGKSFYFQFTLNDYEAEGLEPRVPSLEERINTFARLAHDYSVVWRYDPVIMGDRLTVKRHLRILANLMRIIGQQAAKLVFSFIDIYGRVEKNLERLNVEYRAPDSDEMREFSLGLLELRDKLAPKLELSTCAEAEINLKDTSITKNSCIDPRLINELCKEEIYPAQNTLLGSSYAKDKGQRKACGCAPSKDIGSYRKQPCGHHCVYCYAGHARK